MGWETPSLAFVRACVRLMGEGTVRATRRSWARGFLILARRHARTVGHARGSLLHAACHAEPSCGPAVCQSKACRRVGRSGGLAAFVRRLEWHATAILLS